MLNPDVAQPAGQQSRGRVHQVVSSSRSSNRLLRKVPFVVEIIRQPGQKKVRKIIEGEMSGGTSPKRALCKNLLVSDARRTRLPLVVLPRHPFPPRRKPQQAGAPCSW